jgi:O-antigen/teichoic acid export membrane protein
MIEKNNPSGNMLGRLFSNSAFLLANDILTRGTTFILYALVARYLGAYQFGQLSLALTVLFTFQILAPAGLRLFITREIAKDLTKTNLYLVNGSLIAFFFSILSYLVLFILIVLLNYSRDTASAIFLVALGLLPFSLSTICEAIFQGWERMQYITYANLPRNLGVIGIAFLLLLQGYGISSIAWTLSISYVFLVVIEWWLATRFITIPYFKIDLRFSVETAKKSMAFLGFQGALAISNTVILIILSKLSGEIEVGYYNAASQILTPLVLIINNMVLSAFPAMCRRFDLYTQGLKLLSDNLIELLLIIVLPVVISLVYLSKDILLLLYGNQDFMLASGVLRIILTTLVLRAVSSVLGRDLLAGHREKAVLKIVLIGSVVNILSGLILIRQFGLMGAATTAVIFTLVDFILHYANTSRLFSRPVPWRRLGKSLVAAGILIAFLTFLKISSAFIAVLAGSLIYIIVWVILNVWSAGSLKQLKLKYQLLWSE